MNQTAFDFRASDPASSRNAARDNRPRRGGHRWIALECLAKHRRCGLTDFELADSVHIAQTSIGKRRKELLDLGYVECMGTERPAPSGSKAMVWCITPEGFSYWLANKESR